MDTIARTLAGPVEGRVKEDVLLFAGIPYAAPPVGALRFDKPRPHEGWREPLQAVRFGNAAPQNTGAGLTSSPPRHIHDHIFPVVKALGLKTLHFHFSTGEWSGVRYFPLDKGPSQLEWQVSPNGEKFWAEVAKQVGGPEKAREMLGKLNEVTAARKVEIVRLYVSE